MHRTVNEIGGHDMTIKSIRRRESLILASAALAAAPAGAASDDPNLPNYRILATGLQFPEGPIARPDGSVLMVEIKRKTVSRMLADGAVEVVANLGGGPNGIAIGPDGACYVCNDGGLTFITRPDGSVIASGVTPPDYVGGSIQRLDLTTGAFSTLYDKVNGHALKAPNDLVFDAYGGFWFTDTGKIRERDRDHGGLYWAKPDGSEIREVVYQLLTPNGIALSPDRKRVYVALSERRQLVAYDITGPGTVAMDGAVPRQTLIASLGERQSFDSIAVEANGNIIIGTVIKGGLTVISPQGEVVDFVKLPDFVVAHLAFGGEDLRTIYVTLTSTGRLASFRWPRPGLKLLYA